MLNLLYCLFIFCFASTAFSANKEGIYGSKEGFRFKLEANEDSVTEFVVKIPSHFTQSLELPDQENLQVEFIQAGEKFDSWSEIITVHEFIQFEADLNEFINLFVDHYQSKTPKVECCPKFKQEKNIRVGSIFVDSPAASKTLNGSCLQKFDKIHPKNEIMGMKVVKGEFSIANVQYAIRYAKDSPKEREAAKEKVQSFLDSCQVEPRQIEKGPIMKVICEEELEGVLNDLRMKHGFYGGKN